MTECTVKFCAKYAESPLKEIRFTNFDRETVEIFTAEFRNRFESEDDEKGENENDEKTSNNNATKPTKTSGQQNPSVGGCIGKRMLRPA